MPIVNFTRYTSVGPISKRFVLQADGKSNGVADAQIYNAVADHLTVDMAELPTIMDSLTSNQALGYGICDYQSIRIVSSKAIAGGVKNAIARNKENFKYKAGVPGIIMLDYDPKQTGFDVTPEQLRQIMTTIHPAIGQAAWFVRPSMSATVTGSKSFHAYVPVEDMAGIEEYGKLIFKYLWLKGFGYIDHAAVGSPLIRTIIDGAVFGAERVDFAGRPVNEIPNYNYTLPKGTYIDGIHLDTTSLAELTADEEELVKQLQEVAREKVKPRQLEIRANYNAAQIAERIARGAAPEAADREVMEMADNNYKNLQGDHLLYFQRHGKVTVRDVLKLAAEYDGQALADPLEGVGYGRTTAKFFANIGKGDGKPFIHSMAHGGMDFFLRDSLTYGFGASSVPLPAGASLTPLTSGAPLQQVAQMYLPPVSTINAVLEGDRRYKNLDLLKHIDDNHLLKRLAKHVADEADMPTSTVALVGLAAFSSMSCRRYTVSYPNGKQLPIGLYVVAEHPSGTGKSRCLGAFQAPFFNHYKNATQRIKAKIEALESAVKPDKKAIQTLISNWPVSFVTNCTAEGLETKLHVSQGCFSAVSSEQGLFNSMLGLSYGNDRGANNNDVVLNGFDGGIIDTARVNRIGYAGHVFGGVCCFAQQGSIEKVLDASNGTGVSERFLMAAEQHHLGLRDHDRVISPNPEIWFKYLTACQFAFDIFESPRDYGSLVSLKITDYGYGVIKDIRKHIEPMLADGERYSHVSLRGAASKIDMQIMKIAANLHLMDASMGVVQVGHNDTIADGHMLAAMLIAYDLLEATLALCTTKNIIGDYAEYTAVISYFGKDNDRNGKSEEMILNSLRNTKPFKDFTGNKREAVRRALKNMVNDGVLKKSLDQTDNKTVYKIGR